MISDISIMMNDIHVYNIYIYNTHKPSHKKVDRIVIEKKSSSTHVYIIELPKRNLPAISLQVDKVIRISSLRVQNVSMESV